MKKKIITLVLALLLVLTACGSQPAETTAPAQTTIPTTVPVETTAPPETTEPPVELTRYPLNADSTYVNLAQELPDHIYTTTGSENGLGGTVYLFEGTVKEHSSTNSDGFLFEQIVVETDKGSVMIANYYKALYNYSIKNLGEAYTNAEMPYSVDNYCFPDDGETAKFVAIYLGYSGVAEMPMFYLGANPVLFELLEYPDPAETSVSSPVCEIGDKTVTAGNLVIPIPTGYTAQLVNDNAIMLGSADGKCGISIFAADIIDLDEAAAMLYLPMQREMFYQENVVRTDPESIGTYTVGGFNVDLIYYGEMATDLSTQSVLDATFTDSWYCYTILLRTTAQETTDYVQAYGKMVLATSYTGPTPRFDFVQ